MMYGRPMPMEPEEQIPEATMSTEAYELAQNPPSDRRVSSHSVMSLRGFRKPSVRRGFSTSRRSSRNSIASSRSSTTSSTRSSNRSSRPSVPRFPDPTTTTPTTSTTTTTTTTTTTRPRVIAPSPSLPNMPSSSCGLSNGGSALLEERDPCATPMSLATTTSSIASSASALAARNQIMDEVNRKKTALQNAKLRRAETATRLSRHPDPLLSPTSDENYNSHNTNHNTTEDAMYDASSRSMMSAHPNRRSRSHGDLSRHLSHEAWGKATTPQPAQQRGRFEDSKVGGKPDFGRQQRSASTATYAGRSSNFGGKPDMGRRQRSASTASYAGTEAMQRNKQGKVVCVFDVGDSTPRSALWRMQEELRRQQEKVLRELYQNSSDGLENANTSNTTPNQSQKPKLQKSVSSFRGRRRDRQLQRKRSELVRDEALRLAHEATQFSDAKHGPPRTTKRATSGFRRGNSSKGHFTNE